MDLNGAPESVVVIIAAINEERGIGSTLAGLKRILRNASYLVVDGNSTDRTVYVAEEMGAKVLLQEETGKGQAIAQAIKHVKPNVDYAVFTDADFTYPAEYLLDMIRILRANPDVGMVSGNRFANGSFGLGSMNNIFYVGNRFLALAQRLLNGVKLKDPLTGLRVIRWRILRNWKPKSKGFDIEAEINHLVERCGYSSIEVPINYRDRVGEKKLKLRHGLTILKRILSESIYSSVAKHTHPSQT